MPFIAITRRKINQRFRPQHDRRAVGRNKVMPYTVGDDRRPRWDGIEGRVPFSVLWCEFWAGACGAWARAVSLKGAPTFRHARLQGCLKMVAR